MSAMTAHAIANEFPEFEREDYEALKAEIKANGQQVPIELYKGQILDGRNRYRALLELGIEPQLRDYGGDDPRGHAISLNVRRRHLSPFDLGLLANTLKPKFEKAAAERMKATQPKPGEQGARTRPQASASGRGLDNQALKGKTSEQAAKILGVSPRTVERVAYISKYKPDLIPDIKDGLITIPQAVDKINAQEGLKREQEVAAKQAAARAARMPAKEIMRSETAAEKDKKAAEASERAEWASLNKLFDVVSNLRRVKPAKAARLVPADDKKRVLQLLADTEAWCSACSKLLKETQT
jgi:ParB-like chromosome segregation protein Spo0J